MNAAVPETDDIFRRRTLNCVEYTIGIDNGGISCSDGPSLHIIKISSTSFVEFVKLYVRFRKMLSVSGIWRSSVCIPEAIL